ncbi:MAG TPA: ABC transporter permease, partial [Terriglobia bacterium]|nr:ABC transporter permease [Terriglobia bacterium]
FLNFMFRRQRVEHDMEEELRSHIQDRADDLERQGLARADAERQARIEFGGYQRYKEECREALGTRLLQELIADLRYGLRQLRRNPGFTAVAVITLALGIGANTAIFGVVDSVLLVPLPYRNPQQLVSVYEVWRHEEDPIAPADFLDIQRENHVFQGMAAYETASFSLTAHGQAERIDGAIVSADLFSVLGVQPALGRGFGSGGERLAVLSDELWKGMFGGRRDALGSKLVMNGEVFTIVGVMPASFQFPSGAQLWVPPRFVVPEYERKPNEDPRSRRGSHYFHTVARFKSGVTLTAARADIETICRRLGKEYSNDEGGNGTIIFGLHEELTGNSRTVILLLLAAVGLLLLMACANVANLELIRASGRQKEIAVRTALGCGRMGIVRQFLIEGLLLSLLGGGVGLLVAKVALPPLLALVPRDLRDLAAPELRGEVLAFTLLVSVFAGIIFSFVPALHSSKTNLNEVLKAGSQSVSNGGYHDRLRSSLVIAQVAVALVLLVGAGLVVKSIGELQAVDPGFDSHHVLTARLSLAEAEYLTARQKVDFINKTLPALDRLPGVLSAATVMQLPLTPGSHAQGVRIEGRPGPPPGQEPDAYYNVVSANYFETMRIPLLKGRTFSKLDTAEASKVVVINEELARRFWPNHDALGKGISINGPKGPWREIVGIIADVKQHSLWQGSRPMFYLPYPQNPEPSMTLVIRSGYNPADLAGEVRHAVESIDPNEPVYNVQTMSQVVTRSLGPRRMSTFLLGLFALLALVLATVGIYGVVSYTAAQRTHEIGIRMALGAQKRDVLRLVLGQGMILTLIGVGIGIVGALGLTRFLSSLLYGIKPTDPLTFVVVSLLLTGVALLACYIPARRAMKIDPMEALRYE